MDGISVTKLGFSRLATGSRIVEGTKVDILARKSIFRRGTYEVVIESAHSKIRGTLPEVSQDLIKRFGGVRFIDCIADVAKLVGDSAPVFEPKRSMKEEHTRFLTTKELAILVSIEAGLDQAEIAKAFSLTKLQRILGAIELNSGGLILTEWDEAVGRKLVLSDNGRKLLEKAAGEAPIIACREWLGAWKLDQAAVREYEH